MVLACYVSSPVSYAGLSILPPSSSTPSGWEPDGKREMPPPSWKKKKKPKKRPDASTMVSHFVEEEEEN